MHRTLGVKFGSFRAGGDRNDGSSHSSETQGTFGFERCTVQTVVSFLAYPARDDLTRRTGWHRRVSMEAPLP